MAFAKWFPQTDVEFAFDIRKLEMNVRLLDTIFGIPFLENTQMVTAEITTGATVIWTCLKSQNKERAAEMLRQPAPPVRRDFFVLSVLGGNSKVFYF